MTQFVSALELATYFNGTTELADLSNEWIAQANLLLEQISADVEAAAGCPLESFSATLLLPGTWSRDLELPVGQIREVNAVTLNGVPLPTGSWIWNDRNTLRRAAGLDSDEEDNEGDAPGAQHRDGAHWGGPASTVAVELDGGPLDCPAIARSLVFRIAARTFGNVGQLTQETLGVYSVSYGASTNTNDGSHVTKAERSRLRKALNRTGGTITVGGR